MPEVHMPDMKAKLQDMNESIKQAKMPKPQELKDGYLNSNFHKSFHQQLAVRTRVEGEDLQQIREHMTKNKTPAELAQMNHLFDIPIPKFKLLEKSASAKKEKKGVEMDSKSIDVQPLDDNKFRLYQTLPKSWREQNLVTSAKVLDDQDEAKSRQELVKTKTPAQLAEFNSFSDIPIPARVKSILSPSERKIIAHQRQRRKSSSASGKIPSSSSFKKETFNLSLPRSWTETKLVTQTRDDLDLEEAKKRRDIVQSKSPKELAEFHGLEDIPLPSKVTTLFKQPKPDLKNILKSRSKSESNLKQSTLQSVSSANGSKSYWKDRMNAECLVRKRFEDPRVQASRAEMVKNKTVAELSQINSIFDLPIPSTIQNLKETAQQWPPKRLHQEHQKTMQEYVPQSLKSPLLVSSKYEIDPEVLKERQDLVRSKSPTELSEINSLSDVPIPKFFKTPTSSRPVSPISQPDYSTW